MNQFLFKVNINTLKTFSETLEYLNLIMDLINKQYPESKASFQSINQISLKVIDNGYGVSFCPICNGSVWQNKDESNYCFRCGQKISWV